VILLIRIHPLTKGGKGVYEVCFYKVVVFLKTKTEIPK